MSDRSTIRMPSTSNSIAGLDVVRATAALGVVLLHAGVPYLQTPMPGLAWPVADGGSVWVDAVFWSIELVIMPLFLVIAGMLAWRTWQRRGGKRLLGSRAKRLMIPFAFGLVVILPLDLYVWLAGWVSEGIVEPVKLKSLKFEPDVARDLWGTSHLWFLLYAFLYVAVLSAIGGTRRLVDRSSVVIVAGLIAIGASVLVLRPEVVWGFQHAFMPVPSKWLYSGTFFFGGVLLGSRDQELKWLRSYASGRTGFACAVAVTSTVMLGRWSLSQSDPNWVAKIALAVMTTAVAWASTAWLIGAVVKHTRRVAPSIQYVAAASFWVYLVHHPIWG